MSTNYQPEGLLAGGEGFEPTSLGSKARVLPLDDPPIFLDDLCSVFAEEEGFEPSLLGSEPSVLATRRHTNETAGAEGLEPP